MLFVEHKALSTIGFRRPGVLDIVLDILAAIAAVAGIGVIFNFVLPALHLSVTQQMSSLFVTRLWFRILLVTRTAVVKETVFRGFGLERTRELTESLLVAALVTWALFTMAHLSSWGWALLPILYKHH